jgi:hypothetical protein
MIKRMLFPCAIALSAAVMISCTIFVVEFAVAVPAVRANSPTAEIPLFQFEGQAQLHCPNDSVIWATAVTGTYDASADRWYGRTGNGAYACLHEAVIAGYRAERAER